MDNIGNNLSLEYRSSQPEYNDKNVLINVHTERGIKCYLQKSIVV